MAAPTRIGLFTDTFDEINGVGRFLRDLCAQSADPAQPRRGELTIHTCTQRPRVDCRWRKNFAPLWSRPFPFYADLQLNLPPLRHVLRWADARQFDAIHLSTPGPMGLCGLLAARRLRVPVVATHHTDLPAYAEQLTGYPRAACPMRGYLRWFYSKATLVLARSRASVQSLLDLGVAPHKVRVLPAGVDGRIFHPQQRDPQLWSRLGVGLPHRLFYCGRISVEKNLALLAQTFRLLCARRRDTALVLAGTGPYAASLRQALAGLPAFFLGYQNDAQLGPLYASSDLLVFPSCTDTLGQVVLEAQASGLPALVSDAGGPGQIVEHERTGWIVSATAPPAAWCDGIQRLLDAPEMRRRMGEQAVDRSARRTPAKSAEMFWSSHVGNGQRDA